MYWSWTCRKNLKKERIQCNVFFLVKTLIVTLSSLFPKVILGYQICKGRGNYAATKTSLQFKQQYNYQIMTKLHINYTRMTACHAPTTFINKVQFSKNGNWLRSWLTLTWMWPRPRYSLVDGLLRVFFCVCFPLLRAKFSQIFLKLWRNLA